MTDRADRAGLSVGGYMRTAILNAKPPRASRRPPVVMADLSRLLGQVGKIGSNLNQLAKLAHLGGWPQDEDLRQSVADIRWMRDTLLKALGFTPPQRQGVSRDLESLTT